jgi:predicted nucleic acid-binding protein
VLDTCIIVAAIRSRTGASFQLVDLATVYNDYIEPLLTTALISQYEDVIFRPENRMLGWRDADLHALISSLLVPADWVSTTYSYRRALLDAGDELVLEAAINGQAETIVTFNIKDFRPAKRFNIGAMKPGKLLEILVAKGFEYGEE